MKEGGKKGDEHERSARREEMKGVWKEKGKKERRV